MIKEGNNMVQQVMRSNLLRHLFVIALGILMLYPVLWLISSSFKPNQLIFSEPGLWPQSWTIDNYIKGWAGFQGITFGRFFLNSAVISVLCVVGNVITCSLA